MLKVIQILLVFVTIVLLCCEAISLHCLPCNDQNACPELKCTGIYLYNI